MTPGPAPTLLNDWVTTNAFLAFIGFFAFAVLVWMATEFLKTWHAKSAELDQVLEQGPPPRHECSIGGCHQAATNAFPTGIPDVPYYACEGHTPTVRQWAGPYDHDVPYDQDLDQASDLGRWEQEMRS